MAELSELKPKDTVFISEYDGENVGIYAVVDEVDVDMDMCYAHQISGESVELYDDGRLLLNSDDTFENISIEGAEDCTEVSEHGVEDLLKRLTQIERIVTEQQAVITRQQAEINVLQRENLALGRDIAQVEEYFGQRVDELMAKLYTQDNVSLTPAERLQYAIDLGASPGSIRSFYDGLMIAIGEFADGYKGETATETLTEISELVKVYKRYNDGRVAEISEEAVE